ncbi:MAG: spinster family MFS transporter [Luminiphilus sp.]
MNDRRFTSNSSLAWYATIVLTATYTFSFIDRQIVNLLVEPIKADLLLSDTQISFLQGLAFVVPYLILSIPVGRLVDTVSRVKVLIGGIIFWSVACVFCGLSKTMTQLAIGRMGVGAGEASVTPAAWSLLADYFPEDKRGLPVSIFLMGPYLGAGLSLIIGAEVISWADQVTLPILGDIASWQFTFIAVGLPGILLAMILATLAEPMRKETLSDTGARSVSWSEGMDFVRSRKKVYGAYLLGAPFIVITLYALQAWVPTLLIRVHGMDIADAGRGYGSIALLCGSAGVLSGPVLAKYFTRRGHKDGGLRVATLAAAVLLPAIVIAGFTADTTLALVAIAVSSFFVTVPMALFTTGLQAVTPNEMRGVIAGIYVVIVNLFGLALGPTSVALVTDYVFADASAVGASMAVVCAVSLPVAMLMFYFGMGEGSSSDSEGRVGGH